MKKVYLLVLTVLLICFNFKAYSQNISNEGTDFWAVFPTHIPSGNSLGEIRIFVTSKSNTEVTVSCGSFNSGLVAIGANTSVGIDIPRSAAYINVGEANTVLQNRGIHIKVTEGKEKVSVYAHIWGQARSAASLILPYETLGQTYYSMNYDQIGSGNNFLTLVAVDPNTKIIIHDKGTITNVTLNNPGDAYEYLLGGPKDLTGVYAEVDPVTSSCKRFAAFSGSSALVIGCTNSQDPLYQQLYPTISWGKNYGIVPFKDRLYDLRILAQEDNTTVTYGGSSQTINKGEYISTGFISEPLFISADKLISIAQYSLTQNCSSASGGLLIGDPDMVILNPIEFNIKNITVFSSNLQAITQKFINVLIRADKSATFKINGTVPNAIWKPLAPNSIYVYAQIQVYEESLTLTADDGFNAIAYGYGNAESYAYSAGTNLSSNNYLTVVNSTTSEEGPSGCIDQPLEFKINLPYAADMITWELDNEAPVIEAVTPVLKVVNGQNIYSYVYPVNRVYNAIGEYKLKVTAHVPQNASNCTSGNLVTNYIFNVYDLPVAKFEVDNSACANAEVAFIDKSLPVGLNSSINAWRWDFKDGTYSTEQNPKHKFSKEGDYEVSLSAKSDVGCYSDPVASKTVRILPQPEAKFTANAITCINTDLLFTDVSTISASFIANSKIVNWHWDFGDGNTVDRPNASPFNYQYRTLGTYKAVLTVTSDLGCKSVPFGIDVQVLDLPQANFTMPDICLTDATAAFVNTSTNINETVDIIKYEWNFDAENPNTAGNLSDAKNGLHLYTAAKEYKVELKITNQNGCVSTKVQNFVVNGAVPKADFEPVAENTFCANQPVVILNKSTVDFGNIIKLKVYKDFDNNPTDFEEFTAPVPSQISLNYEPFNLPLTKEVNIRMEAYSGNVCYDVITKPVILNSAPIVIFDDMLAICENDGSIVINQAKERMDLLGNGVYSSTDNGLQQDGTFNPKIAGVGIHNITYTYTFENGCSTSVTKTIEVKKSPYADAGATLYVLAGGQTAIPAMAEGTGLIYSWSPMAGLNNPAILNPIASPERTTDYTLTVTSDNACTASSKVRIVVLEALSPPNSFTPNGDGVNDVWNIKYLDTYPNATVEVFNRNGNRVYFSNGYKVPFDGNYMNQPLPVGVYYFKIDPRNGRKTITGPLTIIR